MHQTYVATDPDRLPWLKDEYRKPRNAGRRRLLALGVAAIPTVAAFSFWLGMNGVQAPRDLWSSRPEATVDLPPVVPAPAETSRLAAEPQMPEVQPVPVPGPIALPQQQDVRPSMQAASPPRRPATRHAPVVRRAAAPTAKAMDSTKDSQPKTLQFASPWESADVSGRMVRIGTYSSLQQGKQAWAKLARVFPGMKRLPAVVTDLPSLRNGKTYYRLQIGTTSQAHSEVLCQRMKAIGQSCVVVDLDGARKGSEDERQPVGL